MLDQEIAREIMEVHAKLESSGKLKSEAELDGYYQTFRNRFGPDRLRSLDGEALLEAMHERKDSLVYWLEFKADNELPPIFGGIGGGSALKFGIYRAKETDEWMTGSPQAKRKLSVEEAIDIAGEHRQQLLAGIELLASLPANGSDADYRQLQTDMDTKAPKVSQTAWGHKYFSMLFPDKLDDYHNERYQRFHLIKLLTLPPDGDGKYIVAGRYVAIALELGIPMNHLYTILNTRDGRPHGYWRVGTSDGKKPRNRWDLMRDGNCVAIGWDKLGNLDGIAYDDPSKNQIRERYQAAYPGTRSALVSREVRQIFNFVAAIKKGDLIFACDGETVLGIGQVIGDYIYEVDTSGFTHRRPVKWLIGAQWKLPEKEGLQTTVHQMTKSVNLIEAERRVLHEKTIQGNGHDLVQPLCPIQVQIEQVLERRGQVVLYGPPGTGKTYWAESTAKELAARSKFGKSFSDLSDEERQEVLGGDGVQGTVRMCSFHPAYGYEDFLEGYRPRLSGNQVAFELTDGIFKKLCQEARARADQNFYLIVDEINRGDIPRIFGELLTIMENEKRGTFVTLPLSGEAFEVPKNVYLIGTMNTADRSIALLDTALRRRFGFIELMPDSSVLANAVVEGIPLGPWLDELNRRICCHVGRDARNRQIGHSYLMAKGCPVKELSELSMIVRQDIIPLLEEYCYEDYSILQKILGEGVVDGGNQRIREDLFDSESLAELVQALSELCHEAFASINAMYLDASSEVDKAGDENSEGSDESDEG